MALFSRLRNLHNTVFAPHEGEQYGRILRYFVPEFVTALILSSILNCVDTYFISFLQSTSKVATVTTMSMLIHLIMKVAEGLSTGTVILGGNYNGQRAYRHSGEVFSSALWTTVLVGGVISTTLIAGAWPICYFFNIPEDMLALTVSFIRLRAIGIFFLFLFFAIVGFLRGIKNARAPMHFFVLGGVVFIVADYLCIFGGCGIPAFGFHGSSIAFIIQYVTMFTAALGYIVFHPALRPYGIRLWTSRPLRKTWDILHLSWPVMLDKATLAGAKMWLVRLIGPLGTIPLASFGVIKDLEQLAFVPAIAMAQVVTFLASNDFGAGNWRGIIANVKKGVMLASGMVFTALVILSKYPDTLIQVFDGTPSFTSFAAQAFPYISILVFCDLAQLLFAGALRGASQVRTVMITRAVVGACVFLPLSLLAASFSIANTCVQFILIYGSFYIANGVMSCVYMWRCKRLYAETYTVQPAEYAKEHDGTHHPRRSPEAGRDFPHSRR